MEIGIPQEQAMNNNTVKMEQPPYTDSEGNMLGSGTNNQAYFNDMLSPFFAPYGIDVSHFPLTNPPIFESAMMMNGQGQLRRRISIANGQIGQITNHSPDDFYERKTQDVDSVADVDATTAYDASSHPVGGPAGPVANGVQVQVAPPLPPQQIPVGIHQQQQQLRPQHQPHQQQAHQPQQQPQQQQQQQAQPQAQAQATPPIAINSNGVPTQKLMYNNEVIFNPEAGPIPGTAAWKKARLLERNRIAASKCRQRKKAAQNQLKENVEKYAKELDDLSAENEQLRAQLAEVRSYAEKHGLTLVASMCSTD